MEDRKLFFDLLECNTDEAVIKVLKKKGYWENKAHYAYLGGEENNYGTINGQQENSENALIEKIINSMDAVLMRECYKRNIDPRSDKAPKNMKDALESFFEIPNGSLSHVIQKRRRELASEITVMAEGEREAPAISIIDKGEGQGVDTIENTILSLNKSNKSNILFVQGKYNSGGTGVLPFCGRNGFSLIVSKRCPDINDVDNENLNKWVYTLTRRFDPSGNEKNPVFMYLKPDGQMLTVNDEKLKLMPKNKVREREDISWGTLIKLYEYKDLKRKSVATKELVDMFNARLTSPALPVRVYERRDYQGWEWGENMFGLNYMIREEDTGKIEEIANPINDGIYFDGNVIEIDLYVYKEDQKTKGAKAYTSKTPIMYTYNGQVHAEENYTFFNNLGLDGIKNSILMIVDLTNLDKSLWARFSMTSRERFRGSDEAKRFREEIRNYLKNKKELFLLQEKRASEKLSKIDMNITKDIQETITNFLESNPLLVKLLEKGGDLNVLNKNYSSKEIMDEVKLKEHPTYFNLAKDYIKNSEEKPLKIPENSNVMVKFDTDVNSSFFSKQKRDDDTRGKFEIEISNGEKLYILEENEKWHVSSNGRYVLNFNLPKLVENKEFRKGEVCKIIYKIKCPTRVDWWESDLHIYIDEKKKKVKKQKRETRNKKNFSKSEKSLPEKYKIDVKAINNSEEREEQGLDLDDGGMVKQLEERVVLYVNYDNSFLNDKTRGLSNSKILRWKKHYRETLYSLTLAMLSSSTRYDENSDNDLISRDFKDGLDIASRKLFRMILPVVTLIVEMVISTNKID